MFNKKLLVVFIDQAQHGKEREELTTPLLLVLQAFERISTLKSNKGITPRLYS